MVGLGGSERVVYYRDACQQALSCGLTLVEQRNPFGGGCGVRRNLLPMVEGGHVQPVEARMVTTAIGPLGGAVLASCGRLTACI